MTEIKNLKVTWNIHYSCNFRCKYCFFEGKWEEYGKRNIYLKTDEWLKYWNRFYNKYGAFFLLLTGGEPFTYPDFLGLLKGLTKITTHINISSNGSKDLEAFTEEFDSSKVSVSLSFQPEFDDFEKYKNRVLFMKEKGFKGCLNFVAYPPYLEKVDLYRREIKELGEELKIIPFIGEWNNKQYPPAYTQEEKKIIGITEGQLMEKRHKGKLCNAGRTSILIFPDGKVARCGQIGERHLLGNFLDENFKLLDKPMPCDVEYCPCDEGDVID